MLLQTNSYIVPKDKRSEHTRLLRKFRQTLTRLGAEHFEVYEQVGANFAGGEATGRFVQIMRFRDRQQQMEVQANERTDPDAQKLIEEFCALINFPYQQQQGLFAVGFYTSALPASGSSSSASGTGRAAPVRTPPGGQPAPEAMQDAAAKPQAAIEEPLVPASAAGASTEQEEGASLLDFAHLDPSAVPESAPLRLVTDTSSDEMIESEIPKPAAPAQPALPTPIEKSDNGHHTGSFSDAPEAMLDLVGREGAAGADEVLSEADREAILGELTGEDVEREGSRQKAEG